MGIVAGRALRFLTAVLKIDRQRLELKIEDAFHHADLDQAALTGALAADQTGDDALSQLPPGEHVHYG